MKERSRGAMLIDSGHIPLRTMLGTCSRDLYRPLRLRLLAWAQRVVFQDLYNVWALLQAIEVELLFRFSAPSDLP